MENSLLEIVESIFKQNENVFEKVRDSIYHKLQDFINPNLDEQYNKALKEYDLFLRYDSNNDNFTQINEKFK